ncbi:MAG: acyltransferase [Pseudomonadota bacterium]
MPTTRKEKILSVQALRGVASVMVLIGHALAEAEHYFQTDLFLKELPWTRGVDLFFVISGFIIVVSCFDRGASCRPGEFLKRRFLRVVPLYWFYTSLMVAALVVIPSGVKDTQFDIAQVFASYLFIPYERYDGRIAPVLSLGWTLNYEIYFYAVFATLVAFGLHRAVFFLALLFVTSSLLGSLVRFDAVPLRFWASSLTLEFVLGALVGYTFLRFGRLEKFAGFGASAVGFIVGFGLLVLFDFLSTEGLPLAEMPRFVLAGVPSAIVVMSAAMLLPGRLDEQVPGFLVALGNSSYSLYLCHRFVLRPLTIAWMAFLPSDAVYAPIYVVVACLCSLAAAHLAFLLIERPFLRLASWSRKETVRNAGQSVPPRS